MPRLMEALSFLFMWFGPGLVVTAIAIGLVHNRKWQFNKWSRWIIMSITAAIALPTPLWSAFATMYVFNDVLHWRLIWAVIIGCGVLILCIYWMLAMLIGLLARLEGVRNLKDILLNQGLAARLYSRFTDSPVGGASICRLSWSTSHAVTDWLSDLYFKIVSWPFRKLGRFLFGRILEKRKLVKSQRVATVAPAKPRPVFRQYNDNLVHRILDRIGLLLGCIIFDYIPAVVLGIATAFSFIFRPLFRPITRNWSSFCPTVRLDQ